MGISDSLRFVHFTEMVGFLLVSLFMLTKRAPIPGFFSLHRTAASNWEAQFLGIAQGVRDRPPKKTQRLQSFWEFPKTRPPTPLTPSLRKGDALLSKVKSYFNATWFLLLSVLYEETDLGDTLGENSRTVFPTSCLFVPKDEEVSKRQHTRNE